MGKALIIAEKPSVAADIAKALGGFTKDDGYFESDDAIVAAARGHLVKQIVPDADAKNMWKIDALPIIPDSFKLEVIDGCTAEFNRLKKLMARDDVVSIVNACDAGREGELIFRLIYNKAGCRKPTKRMWIQSMVASAIRKAHEDLRSAAEFDHLSDAAFCRSEADWIVGVNGTRAATALRERQTQRREVSPVGRVQTPTLAMPVIREREIAGFVAGDYWEIHGTFHAESGTYIGKWIGDADGDGIVHGESDAESEQNGARWFDKAKAQVIADKCKDVDPSSVVDESKPEERQAPALFDLTTLQREANKRFKFSASKTLDIAQALYEKHKATTYPRTDSQALPEDYLETVMTTLASFATTPFEVHVQRVIGNGWVQPDKRIFNNAHISDHFAIVPTGQQPDGLSTDEQKIYDLVSRRFIAVFHPSAKYEKTVRTTIVADETFRASGKVLVDPGWLVVYGEKADDNATPSLCKVADNESVKTDSIDLKALRTKAPKRYTEATLLSAMENAGRQVEDKDIRAAMKANGIGRPATRAAIIEGLLENKDKNGNPKEPYLLRDDNELVPTPKGMDLIAFLEQADIDFLVSPQMTGEWEQKLLCMEKGDYRRSAFMSEIADLSTGMVNTIRTKHGELPEPVAKALNASCPRCGAAVHLDGRAYQCSSCDFKVWGEILGRRLTESEVSKLLADRKTGVLSGFTSRSSGKKFSAALKLDVDTGKIDFEFQDRTASTSNDDAKQLKAKCPKCSSGIEVQTWSYACTGCDFKVRTEIASRKLSISDAEILISKGKTGVLAGFVSKSKRKFSAMLKLDEASTGNVTFEFEDPKD
ncbi:topoisomerase C-terminal repeat-containing protein (plasmid) [Xylella fastidiosa]|uniref:DNA topoisomerase n=1 Tax=Xylella fastidiosa TaxID=2371 RepID=A0ABC8AHU8_XYLFS|nr:DNA topoisomerase [Xylella fastidiosa]ALR07851.1 topoisomerase C-terminal repeat-containing protein [Xylella fastidiosa]